MSVPVCVFIALCFEGAANVYQLGGGGGLIMKICASALVPRLVLLVATSIATNRENCYGPYVLQGRSGFFLGGGMGGNFNLP